ncbi:hypothetical protein [Streptomyces cavernae]|uniref:hypothetical protein n=1 Tax=Streptomyces cavernae TaxID=2259034 RepID=UPI000FEC05DC|nr:hypothetical protein [Streptomyces cavernae]
MTEYEPETAGERAGSEEDFEERLRELLADDAYTIRPSPAPYPTIRRRGLTERRRRVVAAGAALVTLAAVPAGAYVLTGGGGGGQVAAPTRSAGGSPSATASRTPSTAPSTAPAPSGPARPATPGQLLDGITFEQATDGLEKCLEYDRSNQESRQRQSGAPSLGAPDLGSADGYRILLAMKSTGDSNAPGDGFFVVAVKEQPERTRLICHIVDGEASGLNSGVGDDAPPDAGPVLPDSNGGKLYRQSVIDRGNWKVPFRWGVIGRVESVVARVTVSYGTGSSEAVLDHGWFVASGVLTQQAVTKAPRIKGYDAGGKLVYDSDQDGSYEKMLH